MLIAVLGQNGYALLPELEANASHEADHIGAPARRAIGELGELYAQADEVARSAFTAAIDRIANLPEALAPTTGAGSTCAISRVPASATSKRAERAVSSAERIALILPLLTISPPRNSMHA